MIVSSPEVAKWVMSGIENGNYVEGMQAIGCIKDNQIIAGVVFENQNKNAMWGHQRIISPPTRQFWAWVADFIYIQAGCKRFSATVEASNEKAIKLNKHIGFEIEATLIDAGHNGDLHIMTLWKDNCRFLNWKKT
jgi:RimJ/RimL family protein N-acetyltransferase